MDEKFTGERVIWWKPATHLKEFKLAMNLYMEAMQYAIGKTVVDAGCGTGFGSIFLSLVAPKVHAIDANVPEPLLEKNPDESPAFGTGDIVFHQLDLENEPVDITADLCVAIEFIEHLKNPEYFLANLKADSIFFTIPCYGDRNPFHKIEYDERKAAELIRGYFPHLTYRMEARRMIGIAHKNKPLP